MGLNLKEQRCIKKFTGESSLIYQTARFKPSEEFCQYMRRRAAITDVASAFAD